MEPGSEAAASASPFRPHVVAGPHLQSGAKCSPVRTHLGGLVELQDLLKVGRPKEDRRRLAVRDAILQLFPSQVKNFIRENDWPADHPIRSHVWIRLCVYHGSDAAASSATKGFYWETVDQVFERPDDAASLPSFVDRANLLTYHLSEKGCVAVRRVVCALGYTHPDITYCPALFCLASAFLHYMNEEDVYNSLYVLIRNRQGKFLHQTKLGCEAAWRTVCALTKKHAKAAFAHLGKFVHSSEQLERTFEAWFWWIFKHLPFSHLVRIVDCFLFEGKKVLYRVAMSIVILFAKHSVRMDCPLSQEAQRFGLHAAISKFCREIPVPPSKLLKVAFGIRGLSQKNVAAIFLRTEMTLKSKAMICGPSPIARSFSSEGMPTSQSQMNIHATSRTLTIRELLTLWSWLPARITMYQPELIYTTEEHGCSLMTFYARVQDHEPTLMIIKTTHDEIFGAYCSTKWAERNAKGASGQKRTYFGTGETFVFTIYPDIKKYSWVGMNHEGSAVKHSEELFMAGDNQMITIGGGDGQAIWIDGNIRFGGSAPCATFANPPLSCVQDFECKVLEVIGFT